MRVAESIAELRRICQQSRDTEFYQRSKWDKLVDQVSIYFVRLFLEIGISANQATSIGLIIGIIGGVFLIFPNPKYWFIGIALLGLFIVFGAVDGQIARYKKTDSSVGAFWNAIPEVIIVAYVPICISFGIYQAVHSILPLILGFLAVVAFLLWEVATLLPYPVLRGRGLLSKALTTNKTTKSEEPTSIITKYGRFLFGSFHSFLCALLIVTIVDCFVSPFTIGSLSFNARYIYFIIYTVAWVVGAIIKIYLPFRTGVRLIY